MMVKYKMNGTERKQNENKVKRIEMKPNETERRTNFKREQFQRQKHHAHTAHITRNKHKCQLTTLIIKQ